MRNNNKTAMKASADKSLKSVFEKIGAPEKKSFTPDTFQIQAVEAIRESDCLVTAPTGSGKTWIAQQAIKEHLDQGHKIWYATPLKALTNSIHLQFAQLFGKEKVGILTGDIKENGDADIIIGTTEILRNQLYDSMHIGKDLGCHFVILDEAHYLGDLERGVVWEEIIIYLPQRIPILMLSATIGNPEHLAGWLKSIRGQECVIIRETLRPVPLFPIFFHPSGKLTPLRKSKKSGKANILHKTVEEYLQAKRPPVLARPGRLPDFAKILKVLKEFNLLPAIFFLKSRADCDLAVRLCTPEIIRTDPQRRRRLTKRIDELVSKVPHLAKHSQCSILKDTATGSHHSGQLPAWKVVVETLMAEGLLDAMFATSTVAAGVNFPARSVVVLNSDRFNGTEFLPLTPSEFQQMTGRAGRRGKDKIGFAIMLPGKFMNLTHVAQMVSASPLDVKSQIHINFSMVLNLLLSHQPQQIKMLLKKSFASYMIHMGKRGKYARQAFGVDLEYLWEDFIKHLEFLQLEGFVTSDGNLTKDGIWASQLRIDAPLMVAHCLREGLLPDRDPILLAATMAAFVNEQEFDDDEINYLYRQPKRLTRYFTKLRKELQPFALRLLQNEFDAPFLYIQPASALFGWAGEKTWEKLVLRHEFAEGDLARLIMRTAENLRQLTGLTQAFPQVAATAREAIELILKEPVITPREQVE